MARRVFYSFDYRSDAYRVAQVRNMGALEGNRLLSDNDWEQVASRGDSAIAHWINAEMVGKSCVVVLVGTRTATRKWVHYEIKKAWHDRKGVVGVHIHNLVDHEGHQAPKGANPFDRFTVGSRTLSSIVRCYNPPCITSKEVYNHIARNLAGWVEEAIRIRNNY